MGKLSKTIGDKINVGIPTGITMGGLSWSYPLEGVKTAADEAARQMEDARRTLVGIDQDVLASLASQNDNVIAALDQAEKSLATSMAILKKVASEDLPAATQSIQAIKQQMAIASNGIGNSVLFFDVTIAVILMMAAVFMVNGIIVTKLTAAPVTSR